MITVRHCEDSWVESTGLKDTCNEALGDLGEERESCRIRIMCCPKACMYSTNNACYRKIQCWSHGSPLMQCGVDDGSVGRQRRTIAKLHLSLTNDEVCIRV